MRYLDIDKVQPDMILVKPIYNDDGQILLAANKKLTQHYLNRIKKMGYLKLYVYDKYEEDTKERYYNEVLSEELRRDAVHNLKTLNLDAVTFYANRIVDELVSQSDILIDLADIRGYNNQTYEHCINVALLSVTIGIGLGLTNEQLNMLSVGAILHDIGKVVIDKSIIEKQDKLTDEEYEIVKKHPMFGYNMLKDNFEISSQSRVAVLLHHENEDGTGYPFGRIGKDIHIFAKIIHVADVFDALVSERSYKKALSPSDALEFLMAHCGAMFDQSIVEKLIKYVALYPIGSLVELSDGRTAIVQKNFPDAVLRPIVYTEDGKVINLRDDFDNLNLTIINLLD